MTEQEVAFSIRKSLDESVERLPYRVTHRLGAAREAALARMAQTQRAAAVPASDAAVAPASAERIHADVAAMGGGPWSGRKWRVALVGAPLMLLVLGAMSIPTWDETQRVIETAEVDEAVITDELPIAAYADRGFGVFIRNTRQ